MVQRDMAAGQADRSGWFELPWRTGLLLERKNEQHVRWSIHLQGDLQQWLPIGRMPREIGFLRTLANLKLAEVPDFSSLASGLHYQMCQYSLIT